jgi:hypothetical protein
MEYSSPDPNPIGNPSDTQNEQQSVILQPVSPPLQSPSSTPPLSPSSTLSSPSSICSSQSFETKPVMYSNSDSIDNLIVKGIDDGDVEHVDYPSDHSVAFSPGSSPAVRVERALKIVPSSQQNLKIRAQTPPKNSPTLIDNAPDQTPIEPLLKQLDPSPLNPTSIDPHPEDQANIHADQPPEDTPLERKIHVVHLEETTQQHLLRLQLKQKLSRLKLKRQIPILPKLPVVPLHQLHYQTPHQPTLPHTVMKMEAMIE